MSSWTITLGAGIGDIAGAVDIPSIVLDEKLFSEMKPNSNRLDFRALYSSSLWASLRANPSLSIAVNKDAAPYFTGTVSPNFKVVLRNGTKWINFTCEDYSISKLGAMTGFFVKAGHKVCDPADTANSLVHDIATGAGITLSAGLPTISNVVPYVCVLSSESTTWRDILGELLFEYGYVYYFKPDGTLYIVQTVNTSTVSTTGTLTTAAGSANIRGEPEIEKSPEKYDDIRIDFNTVELKTGIVLSQDTTGGDATNPANITLAANGDSGGGDYYPKGASAGEVYSNWNSPDGYDIWIATSVALDATVASGISLSRALTNYYRRASFAYHNTNGATAKITKLRLTGNAYVITAKNTARSSATGGKKVYTLEAQYLFDATSAQNLAKSLGQYYAYSDEKYTVKSKDVFSLGQYVLLSDAIYLNASQKCRVVGRKIAESNRGIYTYSLEAVADFGAISLVDESESNTPTDNSGTIYDGTYNYINNVPPTNNITDLVIASENNADGSVNVNFSWNYTQGTVKADGFLVYYKSYTSAPVAINLNTDPAQFVSASESATAYSFVLPALSARYGGAGSVSRHYRFAVVAVGTRRAGMVPAASGVVEDASWIDKVFVPQMDDIAIRTYAGEGVNRRAVQIDAESLDWIDAPVSGSEQLRARIGRLGVGPSILMDGSFVISLTSQTQPETVINAAASSLPAYVQTITGETRIAYRRNADAYLVERILSAGGTWGSETVINSADSSTPAYFQDADGNLRIAYRRGSDTYLVERVWGGSSWGSETVINAGNSYFPCYYQLPSQSLKVIFRRNSDNYIVESTWNGLVWGTASVIVNSASSYIDACQTYDGSIWLAYAKNSDGYLYLRSLVSGTWGSETLISNTTAVGSNPPFPALVQLITGTVWIFYVRNSDGYIVRREYSSGAWSSETVIISAASGDSGVIQQLDGTLRFGYRRSADNYLCERILARYAQLGAGIIESGGSDVANAGLYDKHSNGELVEYGWGYVQFAANNAATRNMTFPLSFIDNPQIQLTSRGFSSTVPASVAASSAGSNRIFFSADQYGGLDPKTGYRLAGQYPVGTTNTGYEIFSWEARGHWK